MSTWRADLLALLLAGAVVVTTVACSGEDDTAAGTGGSGTAGSGATSTGGSGGSGGTSNVGCDLDAATPPWPDWVPSWPGSGRNATGNTSFWALDAGADITDLQVVDVTASSAVVAWSTPGEADSSVGWGTEPDTCPAGYHRTGGRTEHRLALGPLEPATEYFVTVRSRDDSAEDRAATSFTTAAPPAATELTACGTIDTSGRYRLTADVTADCTCFDIQADDVELDLGWHRVTYADSATTEQCAGVAVEGNGAVVARGIVEQGAAGGDLYSHAVRIYGVDHTRIEQLWLRVHAADAFGLRSMYSDDVVVHHVLVVSEVQDVTDRHYPGNRGIALDLSDEGLGEVMDCVLFGVPHWGIFMTGGDRLTTLPSGGQTRRIGNNHVFADMHATNGYGLGVHANHVEVDHNEIRPLHNGRALHYTRSNGHIHHNIIEAVELIAGPVAEGFASYSDLDDPASPHDASVCSWVVAHGIRVESGNYGIIHHNEVYTYSLADVSFGATSLNISTSQSPQGGIEVHHNQFTAHQAAGSISCGGGLPIVAGWVRGDANDPPITPADLHDNRFVSNGETLDIEDPALGTSADDELVQE